MKVSRNWLQQYFTDTLPPADALAHALTFHAFEIDGVEEFEGDAILDVKVTPNRGHDALSHRGIAAELSAILKLPLNQAHDPLAHQPSLTPTSMNVSVALDSHAVRRYSAAIIRGVTVGPSPEWLQKALASIGQRSINTIVDATNYVMFSMGQPLHAYDLSKLGATDASIHIAVRPARAGERVVGLDTKEYTLSEGMLVIANAQSDAVLGIAGVKGGVAAQIDAQTTDIVLEAANFDGVNIRKTSQALKLRTDASARFEQEIAPALTGYGMAAVIDCILRIAGGTVEGYVDVYPEPQQATSVTISFAYIERMLGVSVSPEESSAVLERLGFLCTSAASSVTVVPPPNRLDILSPEDVLEEIVRSIGYDRIPAVQLPPSKTAAVVNPLFAAAERERERLMALGYSEVLTSVFSEQGERAVANKLGGDRPYLRTTLIKGLTDALARNIPHKDLLDIPTVRLFEIGPVWKDGREEMMVGYISEKETATEQPLVSEVATAYETLPLAASTARYQPFSRFPYIVRDIALWVPDATAVDSLRSTIAEHAGALLVATRLFDTFAKNGRVSYAFRLVFQSTERTLTDAEVGEAMQRVSDALAGMGYEIR